MSPPRGNGARTPARQAAPRREPSREERRRSAVRFRVIDEATRLFSLYGFRRTSVDMIAAAAQVAKPTLYAYFPDKDALFLAVTEALLERIWTAAVHAGEGGGDIAGRLTAVLAAKFTHVFEVVHRSPHAAELLGSGSRLATAAVEESDRRYAAWLRQVVEGAVLAGELDLHRVGLSSRKVADALLRLGHGAAYRSGSAEEHRRHLGELVELVVAGLRPPRR